MDNNKKFLSDIEFIVKASQTKKLVVLVGAGISMNSGVPSWGQLIHELKNDIGISDNETKDDLQVAQIYYNEKKHKEYIEKVRKILLHKKTKYNELHEIIFKLNPEYVLTTNYDDLLEQVIKKRALPFSVIKKDVEFPYAANSNLLIKIHGDLDDNDFILKEDDYIDYETDHPLFEAFIKSVFSTKVVLFVGYSYSDINLKIILQKVRNILGRNYQNSFMLTYEEFSTNRVDYLKNKGVTVISYATHKESIDSYLNGNNAKGIVYKVNEDLNQHGYGLLKLLTYVSVYDRFKEKLREESLIDQLYISFRRFSEIKSLPYFFIANLFPLNNKDRFIYRNEHVPFVMRIINTNILDFFKNNTHLNNNKLTLNQEFLDNYQNSSKKYEVIEKFNYVIKCFKLSGIYWLSKEVRKDKDSIYLGSEEHKDCECNQCLYSNFNFRKLLENISIANVTEISRISDDSSLAYTHYKLGNIYNAYTLFEQVAQKSWDAGNYIIYFISKINIKRLGHFIHYAEYKNLTESKINDLKREATNIDLEAEYFQINSISKEESELIKIIRDNTILDIASEMADGCYSKILKNYEKSKFNEIYYDNSTNLDNVNFLLLVTNLFYEKNYIVNDYFSEYKAVISKACESILIDYKTNHKYIEDEEGISLFIVKNIILYSRASEFYEFFKKYKLKKVKLTVDSKSYLLNCANNYLSSFYSVDSVFKDSVETHDQLAYQTKKGYLQNEFSAYFDNLFLLLSKVDLSSEEYINILEKLCKFLEIANFIYWHNLQYVASFIGNNANSTNNENILPLLRLIFKKQNVYSTELLEYIGGAFCEKNSELRISDSRLIDNLIDISLPYDRANGNFKSENLIYIWEFSDDVNRRKLEELFIKLLEENFDCDLYYNTAINKIIDYKIFFDKYFEYVNLNKASNKNSFFSDFYQSGINNFIFIQFIIFTESLDIPHNQRKFDTLENIEDYMEFFIDPEKFDYSKFNISWLLLSFNIKLHKKLSTYNTVKEKFAEYLKHNLNNHNLKDLYIKYYA